MLKQVCPRCMRLVEVPENSAGKTINCPACQATFTVPGTYTPMVDSPNPSPVAPAVPASPNATAPPPGFVPPAPPAAATPTSTISPASRGGISLSPSFLEWAPAICFTLILLLTFFSWIGLFPGGYKAYSQSPWGALTGSFTTDFFSEQVVKLEAPLKKTIGSNFTFLLPYFVGLFLVTVLAWADRFVTVAHITALPASASFIQKLWPHRFPVIAILSVLLLILFLLQLSVGYGLENAVGTIVTSEYTERLTAANGASSEVQKINVEAGMKLGSYQLQTTTAFAIVTLLHLAAVLIAAGRFWLYRRGAKPAPRISFDW